VIPEYSECNFCTAPIRDNEFVTIYFNKSICEKCLGAILKSSDLNLSKPKRMMNSNMILAFDLDGTLCSLTENANYHLAEPFLERISYVNELYEQGYYIKIFTARGQYSKTNRTEFTKKQLKEWGVKYHELVFKTAAHFYIDDRAVRPEEFFKQ